MRRFGAAVPAASVTAVLAFALTACGGDAEDAAGKDTAEDSVATPGDGDRKGSTDSAERTQKPKSPNAAPKARKTEPSVENPPRTPAPENGTQKGTPPAPRPTPPTRPTAPGGGGTTAGATSAQGTWYTLVRRQDGEVGVLTVRGTALSITAGAQGCSGTLTAAMTARVTCAGQTATGKGSVNGQRISLTWDDGSTDVFARTKPAA